MSAGSYITETDRVGAVHFRPDPAQPVTACGINYEGIHATTHPITNGAAFDCTECLTAWEATR